MLAGCVGVYYVKLEAQKLFEPFSDEEFYQLLREPNPKVSRGNDGLNYTKDTVVNQKKDGI